MALFKYHAKDYNGASTEGTIEAPDLLAAENLLRDRQLIILELIEQGPRLNRLDQLLQLVNRVRSKDLVFFSRQLAVLIGATVPLVRALKILVHQTDNHYFKGVIADLTAEVDGGAKLSEALKLFPKIFDHFFIYMVRAGETTGRLDEVLNYLAEQKEKDYALTSRIKGAMVYPAFIVVALVVIGIVMLVKVVPQLTSVLEQSNAEIPATTQLLISLSDGLTNYWWLIIILIFILTGLLKIYQRTKYGAWYIDLIKLKLPIFGSIYQKIYLARFSRGLANLVSAGVPITSSLEIMAEVVNNQVYRDLIYKASSEVEVGNPLADTFMASKQVPPIISNMLAVGEETGRLDQVLRKVADFYALEVDAASNALANLIEPVIMVVIGVAVLFLVLSILTPIYNLSSAL